MHKSKKIDMDSSSSDSDSDYSYGGISNPQYSEEEDIAVQLGDLCASSPSDSEHEQAFEATAENEQLSVSVAESARSNYMDLYGADPVRRPRPVRQPATEGEGVEERFRTRLNNLDW